ncbi:MAG: FAD-dependent oxidoreductase [Dongiaceae bacterium]
MSLIETRHTQVFPTLTAAQIAVARRFASGPERRFAANEVLFAVGDRPPAWLVLEGEVEIGLRDGAGHEHRVAMEGAGQFTGEVSQLTGRPSLAEAKAGPRGCLALPFDTPHLRALIIGSAEVGEIVMRALILRRTALIDAGGAGPVLVGRPDDPRLIGLQGFLGRNGHPFSVLQPADEGDGHALIERLGLQDDDLPILLCPNGTVLKRPSLAQAASCLGMTPEIDPERRFDVAVVGAGPAGLATAVYAASEGLSVLVLDGGSFGGQAGASARIENYLGFPTGISGHALAARAYLQAEKFGAEIAIPVAVEALACGGLARQPGHPFRLRLEGGREAQARSVVVASGARYRRPAIANLGFFEGSGISYWASPVEAKLCEGEEVALIGGGNSAGQAVVYLAARVRRLHLVVRGAGLAATMSRYLVDRIAALPNVVLHARTEVTALVGDAASGLQGASFRHCDTGESWTVALRHLFLFIGADPNTAWLEGCLVARDAKGFVRTGEPAGGEPWPAFGRAPLALETSVPGVFAIGDVRAGSTKRVAAAVGEGAQVVAALHGVLAEG